MWFCCASCAHKLTLDVTKKSVFCSWSVGRNYGFIHFFLKRQYFARVFENPIRENVKHYSRHEFFMTKNLPKRWEVFSGIAKANGRLFASFAGIFDGRPLMLWLGEPNENLHKYTYHLLRYQMARKRGSGAQIQFCRIRLENNWKDFG